MNKELLAQQLINDEGKRALPYFCPAGKYTIGVGHNLDDKPLSERAIMTILDDDIVDVISDLDRELPWWKVLDEVRQLVLANMCFNLGILRLLQFKRALAAMQAADWNVAADEMSGSKWSVQVGPRAKRLIAMMRTGKLP